MDYLIGHTFDGYELKEYVGNNGWVEIYKGFNNKISWWAVIRFISTAVIAEEELARFRHWAQAIATLRHRNISTIYGSGEAEDWIYIILEDVPGGSLKDRLVSDNPFTWDQTLSIVIPISQALAYAHKQGITNWAIEPANILLPQEDLPLLSADFELPKSLRTSDDVIYLGILETEMVRELAYTAPEPIQGKKTDARSDVYSLGVILYELLSGRLPYEDETSFDFLMARLTEPPLPLTQINPDVPRVFELILNKALALDPDDRYQTMEEFAQVLIEARKSLNRSIAGKYEVVIGEDEATALNVASRLQGTEIVLKLSGSGQEIFVGDQPELTIGRASKKGNMPNPDFDLTPYGGRQGGVSRRHGRLLYKDDQWFVEDLGSTNGTFVNGVKISSPQMVPVYHGDILRFGRIELEFSEGGRIALAEPPDRHTGALTLNRIDTPEALAALKRWFQGPGFLYKKPEWVKVEGADLVEANLSASDLSNKDLFLAKLHRANLSQADLSRADLRWADLTQANMSGATLTKTDLRAANLIRANLSVARLHGADMRWADLTRANLEQASLVGADLSWADFHEASLTNADLSPANLSEASLIRADLSQANFSQANLSQANLSWADLRGANLRKANLSEANLHGADLRGANLKGANMDGANLYGVKRGQTDN